MNLTSESTQVPDVIAVKRNGLRVEVASSVRRAIFSGSLKPGDQIRETEMAAKIGVSRGPLREALIELQKEGLVEIKPNHGAFVRVITSEEVAEIFTMRIPLETVALLCAKPRVTPRVLQSLETSYEKMAAAAKSDDLQRLIEEEFEFHKLIWAASGNSLLNDTLIRLCTPLFAFAGMVYKPFTENLAADVECHRPLIEFLAGTTERSALECQRLHFSIMREPLGGLLKQSPAYALVASQSESFA
jgi:DNA-binding GntR family transcriptional regulator